MVLQARLRHDRRRPLRCITGWQAGSGPAPGTATKLKARCRYGAVMQNLREGWSPEQIAGMLKRAWPDDPSKTVSHETIYTALYVMPRGGLRKEWLDRPE